MISQSVFVLDETRHEYGDHDDDHDVDSFDDVWGLWEQGVEYLLKPNSFSEVYQRD